MNILFTARSWVEYQYFSGKDKQTLKKLNAMVEDARRSPFSGLGKPEALKGDLSGFWSRRVTQEHRLVYTVANFDIGQTLVIAQCRFHY